MEQVKCQYCGGDTIPGAITTDIKTNRDGTSTSRKIIPHRCTLCNGITIKEVQDEA